VLLAGITGYLGSYIAKELQKRAYIVRAIVRNPERLKLKNIDTNEILKAEVTQPDSIKDCCRNIDVVISTVGITRQKDGLTYMDVDYKANMNLLQEAKKSEVKKFIYVSVLNRCAIWQTSNSENACSSEFRRYQVDERNTYHI
jgi:uncharacterized protein YbjT (DUF2867 family)